MNDPVLTEADFLSPTWLKLKEYFNNEIGTLDRRNRNNLDAVETANVRGRVAAFKQVLGLAEKKPIIESKKPHLY